MRKWAVRFGLLIAAAAFIPAVLPALLVILLWEKLQGRAAHPALQDFRAYLVDLAFGWLARWRYPSGVPK